jgi:hypothetical protein
MKLRAAYGSRREKIVQSEEFGRSKCHADLGLQSAARGYEIKLANSCLYPDRRMWLACGVSVPLLENPRSHYIIRTLNHCRY